MTSNPAVRFLYRVYAMAAKEGLHIQRDPRVLYLALGMPVVMLLLFGYGVRFDIDHIKLVVADADRTASSRALVTAFSAPAEFTVVAEDDAEHAERRFRRFEAAAALLIPAGYEQRLLAGRSGDAQILVDGADGTVANQVIAKSDAIARSELSRRLGASAIHVTPPISVSLWTRYNPDGRSATFLVPGLAAFLVAIGAVLLTALTVAVEWERGSMEQLFASPVGRLEIILGKLLPYLAIGMVQFTLVIAMGATIFEVPLRGPLPLLFLLGFTFLVGMLAQGLLVSVVTRSQMLATQVGALSALLPSLLLSGMLFPLENMPRLLQAISLAIPARYLVHALRAILLKGQGFAVVWPDLVAQLVFSLVVLALATRNFRRRLA